MGVNQLFLSQRIYGWHSKFTKVEAQAWWTNFGCQISIFWTIQFWKSWGWSRKICLQLWRQCFLHCKIYSCRYQLGFLPGGGGGGQYISDSNITVGLDHTWELQIIPLYNYYLFLLLVPYFDVTLCFVTGGGHHQALSGGDEKTHPGL